jgi:ElaB/YqjD/DUF883 family membrane-anchored ribosome-binding protein
MNDNDTPLWGSTAASTESDPDREIGERIDEIEITRTELVETADELGQRLDPGNLMKNAKQTARDATVGKVEAMANQAGDVVNDVGMQARETGGGIIDTMRRNPIPTALAGIGIAWLWMNRTPTHQTRVRYMGGNGWNEPSRTDRYSIDRRRSLGETASGAFDSAGDAAGDAVDAAGRKIRGVGNSASDAVDSLGRRADAFADDARRTFDDVGPQVRNTVEDAGDSARRVVEENPLAAGAIALAVGTAVGLAMPATRAERDFMGDAGSRMIDQAQEAAAKPLEKAERKIREATPAGASAD